MKAIILLLFLAVCALGSIGLGDIDDSSLGPLLSGDWQSLLPDNLQDTRAQLIKLLTPSPPAAPQHAMTSHRHYRLANHDIGK
jgi:hypothetical protein